MRINEYQELAMRTNDGKCTWRLLESIRESGIVVNKDTGEMKTIDVGEAINAGEGLSGEVGEVNDIIKKWIYHGHELDEQELKKELGDVCWYLALTCNAFGYELDEIMSMNIDKLKQRYPDGFSEQASINRVE